MSPDKKNDDKKNDDKKSKKDKKKSAEKAPDPTLRDLVGAYVAAQATVIMDALPALREHDAAALVASVAAVRRLRSTLRTCEELLDIPRATRFDDDLAAYGQRLEAVTDLDQVEERIAEAVADLPVELVVGRVSAQLQTEVQLARKEAWDHLVADLDTDRTHQLLAQLHQWRSDTPFTAEADRPAKKVNAIRKRTQERAERRRDTARAAATHDPYGVESETVTALERARAAAQRQVHLQELVDRTSGGPEPTPDLLEEHRLSLLTGALLRATGIRVGVRSGHNGFSYGLLFAQERRRQRDLAGQI